MSKETVHKISTSILNHLKAEGYEDPNLLRLGIGLTLSGVHSAMLHSAQTKESQREAVETCLNTIDRLCQSFKRDVEKLGIAGVEVTTGIEPLDGHDGPIQ